MFDVDLSQRDAWVEQVRILKDVLAPFERQGKIYFEYSVPRLGKRIDVVALIEHVLFVLEFKVGDDGFSSAARDQVWDYALDLKNFHEPSHAVPIAPVLIATKAQAPPPILGGCQSDGVFFPINATPATLGDVIERVLRVVAAPAIDVITWERGRYCPTPTIIEAATALYAGHDVSDISRSDASAINLRETSEAVSQIIREAKERSRKSICFVTGVPGAGKTRVGLNIATQHINKSSELYSVFLSGNGPLVAILREALARDKVQREKEAGRKIRKSDAMNEVQSFIQNVHHFRDDGLADLNAPPIEHVALFDEAQRAWNLEQTSDFMRRKRNTPDFNQSEPQFLISCMDRHPDWAVIVCLVGGGQEINTGEAGISEWIESVMRAFPDWNIHISSRLQDAEYGAGAVLKQLVGRNNVDVRDELHLSVSMRSFRAENVSAFVKQSLDLDEQAARRTLLEISEHYPIVLTRDLTAAKRWLKNRARGTERCGIIVSSQAQRLKPLGIDVKSPVDPIRWFLEGKADVRSSYYLEDVATEFDVQGLELDWSCIVWDADLRLGPRGWEHWAFRGARWQQIRKAEDQTYLKNAYRVLLTRARQGMVIVVPRGNGDDHTRPRGFYDSTFEYLERLGVSVIGAQ
jgi:hypothetical protein